jgi:hypothetical protein
MGRSLVHSEVSEAARARTGRGLEAARSALERGGELAVQARFLLSLQSSAGNRAVAGLAQRWRDGSGDAGLLQEARRNETGLPDELKSGIESLSGISLDDVRVHYGSSQPAELGALAYAQGSDIHLAPGQERHLAHEAWHAVQQAQGRVQATKQLQNGVQVNDDQSLEHEADAMGAKALIGAGQRHVGPKDEQGPRERPAKAVPVAQGIAWHEKHLGTNALAAVPTMSGVEHRGTTTLDVSGRDFKGPLYELPPQTAANKVEGLTAIAGALGNVQHPAQDKFLAKSQLETLGLSESVPAASINAAIANGNHRSEYRGKLDPYIIRGEAQIGEEDPIALHYQFGKDSYGYIVTLEQEGKAYSMHGERGQEVLPGKQRKKLKAGSVDDLLFEKFSSAHDTDESEEFIAEVAETSTQGPEFDIHWKGKRGDPSAYVDALKKKSKRLDAVTKIAGEGARWVCVRELARTRRLTNNSRFYTSLPGGGRDHCIFMTFKDLWGAWAELFRMQFNITNQHTAYVLRKVYENRNDENSRGWVKRLKRDEFTINDYDLGQ